MATERNTALSEPVTVAVRNEFVRDPDPYRLAAHVGRIPARFVYVSAGNLRPDDRVFCTFGHSGYLVMEIGEE